MKKIIYIITATLLALTACTKELPWNNEVVPEEQDSVYPEGAQVDLVFAVPSNPQTKGAMDDNPKIDNLFVAIFDGAGILKEYVEAEPLDGTTYVSTNGEEGAQRFKARVTLKNAERRIHFLANGPAKSEVTGGMESSLLQQWMTEYKDAAFWQRIVLPNGITAHTFSGKDSNGNPLTAGTHVYYYYTVSVDEGDKEVYTPASSSTPGAESKDYVIYVTDGRPYYKVGNMTVNPGDFVNAKGEKILDGTGYFQSEEVAGAVNLVPMVRNFARVKIVPGQVSGDDEPDRVFTPQKFYLMNIPDRGTIAPYSATIGGFVPQFTTLSSYDEDGALVVSVPDIRTKTNAELLASLNAGRYPASIPSGGKLIQTEKEVKDNGNAIPTTWQEYTVAGTLAETESAFLYERGLPNKSEEPTYLLVGGTLTGYSDLRWFKIELTDANGAYFRVFRGVTYAVELNNITGSDGHSTAALAAVSTPVSDVSNALATENLEQVNDGKGTSMWVKYIDYVGNDPDGEEVAILYKVFDSATGDALSPDWDDDQNPATPNVSRYTLSCDPEASESTSGAVSAVTSDAEYNGTDTPDGKDDWRIATVTLVKPSTTILLSTLTIAGVTADGETSGSGKTLSRKVKYHVMNTQRLTLSATPLNSEAAGEETELTIKLPTGLGYSMFPLTFKIEAEKANLNPVASKNKKTTADGSVVAIDLPVESGPSYFANQNSFGYLFTLNYSDYYNLETSQYTTEFKLYFSTSKDYTSSTSGSNETWISVTDDQGYFEGQPANPADMYNPTVNHAVTQLTVNGGNSYFNISPLSQTVSPLTKTATFSISANSGSSWSVEAITSGVDVSPASGSGNGVVTMSFTENPTNAERPLRVRVTSGSTTKDVTVTQQAPTISFPTTASVAAATTFYDLDITSNTAWTAEVVSGDATIVKTKAVGDQVTGSGNGTVRITFGENSGAAREFKVRVYATDLPTISQTLTLTQRIPPQPTERTISVGSGTFSTGYVYNGVYDSELSMSFANGTNRNNGYIEVSNSGGAITIEADTISKIVVTYTNNNSGRYAATSTTIGSGGGSVSNTNSNPYTTTWTGSSSSVTLNFAKASTRYNFRISEIKVTYLVDE